MNKNKSYYDPHERAIEKQLSREEDKFSLASGQIDDLKLRKINGKFAFPGAIVDWNSAKRIC